MGTCWPGKLGYMLTGTLQVSLVFDFHSLSEDVSDFITPTAYNSTCLTFLCPERFPELHEVSALAIKEGKSDAMIYSCGHKFQNTRALDIFKKQTNQNLGVKCITEDWHRGVKLMRPGKGTNRRKRTHRWEVTTHDYGNTNSVNCSFKREIVGIFTYIEWNCDKLILKHFVLEVSESTGLSMSTMVGLGPEYIQVQYRGTPSTDKCDSRGPESHCTLGHCMEMPVWPAKDL